MNSNSIFDTLLLALPSLTDHHAPSSKVYAFLKQVARREVEGLFSDQTPQAREIKPIGELIFPYHSMGAIDSLNLFDLNELIIFSFYWVNRKRYRRVLDAGANIGLHSIILGKCGLEVRAYEPDPQHFQILERNLMLNDCSGVEAFACGLSSEDGVRELVRVLGNTTGSHLAGAKANPYGDLERFPVKVKAIEHLMTWADLIKLDVEGHEREVLLSADASHWLTTDCLVEIENENNAAAIYEHFTKLGVRLFSQKTNWHLVKDVNDMPTSYREGTLFVTRKSEMPWS